MQLIKHTDYKELCDNEYVSSMDVIPDGNTIFVHLDHIYKFLKLANQTDRSFTVVSGSSDYGLQYQQQHPVWADMEKWLRYFVAIDKSLEYNPILMPSRCDTTKCRIDDSISVKMHSWTLSTFNEIPKSIKQWFVVNSNIQNSRIVNIPFGIPDWTYQLIKSGRQQKRHLNNDRKHKFTFACSINSCVRLELSKRVRASNDIYVPKETLSHEEYIETLFNSRYVICPEGNGLDSYRVLESIYCGAIPIVLNEQFTEAYDTRVVRLDNWYQLFNATQFKKVDLSVLDYSCTDLHYWVKRICGT